MLTPLPNAIATSESSMTGVLILQVERGITWPQRNILGKVLRENRKHRFENPLTRCSVRILTLRQIPDSSKC